MTSAPLSSVLIKKPAPRINIAKTTDIMIRFLLLLPPSIMSIEARLGSGSKARGSGVVCALSISC